MTPRVLAGMRAELEKLALGVVVKEFTPEQMGGRWGVQVAPSAIPEQARQQFNIPENKALIGIAPHSHFDANMTHMGVPAELNAGKAYHDAYKRHELIHYIRGRKGLTQGVSEPGLRNVLRTAREEIAANLGAARAEKNPKMQKALAAGIVPEVLSSMHLNYAQHGGPLKASLGGTLKPLLPWAQRLGIVK